MADLFEDGMYYHKSLRDHTIIVQDWVPKVDWRNRDSDKINYGWYFYWGDRVMYVWKDGESCQFRA